MLPSFFRSDFRVLFLCTANVCRSPLAEALLKQQLRERGLVRRVQVSSAGTRVATPGRRPDPRMERLAQDIGVSLSGIRARQVRQAMLARSDLILAMEPDHLEDLRHLTPDGRPVQGAGLLGRYLSVDNGEPEPIKDPYFGDGHCFEAVFTQIQSAVAGVADELERVLPD